MSEEGLREKLEVVCTARQLVMGEAWVQKVLQLKQVSERTSISISIPVSISSEVVAVSNTLFYHASVVAVRCLWGFMSKLAHREMCVFFFRSLVRLIVDSRPLYLLSAFALEVKRFHPHYLDNLKTWVALSPRALISRAVFQVLELRHGVMMVGPSGSGKTTAWRCLLSALEMLDGVKGEAHVIDPKAIGVSRSGRVWFV